MNRMGTSWQSELISRLAGAAAPTGGWGYHPGGIESSEPTALAVLALSAHEEHAALCARGLSWLASIQNDDGGVPVVPAVRAPCWPTGLCLLAWVKSQTPAGGAHDVPTRSATSWLLHTQGTPIPPDTRLVGHDTTLIGWSWVADTHSWVEPTAVALLALRGVGQQEHARVREGVRLLVDRALADGGWNYGNTRVLDNTLRPFPAPTGIALASLAGEPENACVRAAIRYLHDALHEVRSPMSLAWGLIGLSAWNARPSSSDKWLAESAVSSASRKQNCLNDALLLLAGDLETAGALLSEVG